MQEKENIIKVLNETKKAVEKRDTLLLKDLSNQTIHTSSIYQDSDNILIAVIIYSLSKMLERKKYSNYPGWEKFLKKITSYIDNSISCLGKENIEGCRIHLENIRKEISKLSKDFRIKIQDVFSKAKINKASKIYEHGISMEKTAKLLGISLWELAEYAGGKVAADSKTSKFGRTISEKQRIKNAMEIFK